MLVLPGNPLLKGTHVGSDVKDARRLNSGEDSRGSYWAGVTEGG